MRDLTARLLEAFVVVGVAMVLGLTVGCNRGTSAPNQTGTEKPAPTPESAPSEPTISPGTVAPTPAAAAVAESSLVAADSLLMNPTEASLTAPESYSVRLKTTKGDVVIDVTRAWAPLAADRFYTLVKIGYFANIAFFRVVKGFMAQAGIHGNPQVNAVWTRANIKDEPVTQSNTRGMVTLATAGRDRRATQFFINFVDNSRLDNYPPAGFPPFGKVRDMAVMDTIYSGYGEGAPMGRGPSQGKIASEGNAYLKAEFPEMDYILSAAVEPAAEQ